MSAARVEAGEASKAPKVDTSTVKVTDADGVTTYTTARRIAAAAEHGVFIARAPQGACPVCGEDMPAGAKLRWRPDTFGALHHRCRQAYAEGTRSQ